MTRDLLLKKVAGLEPWEENYGDGMETRRSDGVNWYDLSINCNSLPCEPELCVIVTSWMGQLKWLKSVLASYRRTGALVILSYDNPFYAWVPQSPNEIIRCMPNMSHYLLANCFVSKHITYDSDKRNGWFWNVRYAQGIIKQFPNIKYVYCTNGDCLIEKPEGFKDIIALLGDNEFITGQSTESVFHTATMFFKTEAFHKIVDGMAEIMRVPVVGSHSPEVMLRELIAELKIKAIHAPKQPLDPDDGSVDMYARHDQDSTWKELLGFKNLFAIYETAGNMGRDIIHFKDYVDNYCDFIYWAGEERETICKYWETGDLRYLWKWHDQWEDSWYNRLYMPLEHYGKEPVYGNHKG